MPRLTRVRRLGTLDTAPQAAVVVEQAVVTVEQAVVAVPTLLEARCMMHLNRHGSRGHELKES